VEALEAQLAASRAQLGACRAEAAACEQRVNDERERRPAAEAQLQQTLDAVCDEIDQERREEAARLRRERAEEAARLRAAAAESAAAAARIERELDLPAAGQGTEGIIAWEHITLGEQIGRGSFKVVHRGEMRGTPIAALLMPGGSGLQAEVALMARLGISPNIAACYGLAHEPGAAAGGLGRDCLVMELAPHGALVDCLEQLDEAALPLAALLSICTQVAHGMCAVSSSGIIHSDLAARNVLVSSVNPPHVKITDFGLSRHSAHGQSVPGTQSGVLSVRWAPPEAISGRRKWVLELSDVWSFGVLMWEVYTRGFVPYDMIQTDDGVAAHVCGGGRLEKPADCPDAVYQVMCACWTQRPQDRPCFTTLAAWLQGIARGEDARPALPPIEERALRECVICMSEPRVSVVHPCRHCCMCGACSLLVDKCPICRRRIESRVELAAPPDRTFVGD